MTIRVLLADDQPVVRAGLRGMFEADPEFDRVGQAASGRAAVEFAEARRPDVVLLDLRLADRDEVAGGHAQAHAADRDAAPVGLAQPGNHHGVTGPYPWCRLHAVTLSSGPHGREMRTIDARVIPPAGAAP